MNDGVVILWKHELLFRLRSGDDITESLRY